MRLAAFTNMAFNLQGNLDGFVHFLAKMQAGDWAGAAAEMLDFEVGQAGRTARSKAFGADSQWRMGITKLLYRLRQRGEGFSTEAQELASLRLEQTLSDMRTHDARRRATASHSWCGSASSSNRLSTASISTASFSESSSCAASRQQPQLFRIHV